MELLIAIIIGIIIGKLYSDYKYWTRPQANQITINHTNNTQVNNMQHNQQEIAMLRNELMNLRSQVQFAQIDKLNGLPVGINQALDTYNMNNIQVPLEVIEAVAMSGIVEPQQAIQFIENERRNMKSELGKRLYV
ncbi:GP16.7-like replication protein [Bacillus phage Harambe]|uniref:Early protein n=2 Tax=Harambevirus TaxID=2842721 RepID=A0A1W6JSD4_9CAUD|nr:GP16.7-like replication protein [Bacillus phage Harambe]YP_009910208.1 GP16.7-like replication protein [Bacillus phage BeachBum]ARM70181.1 early protein [Bacillus phage Harambe]ARQ95210.1 early protein [Bacillus phage BeachBum]